MMAGGLGCRVREEWRIHIWVRHYNAHAQLTSCVVRITSGWCFPAFPTVSLLLYTLKMLGGGVSRRMCGGCPPLEHRVAAPFAPHGARNARG